MGFLGKSPYQLLREFEDKSLRNDQYERVKNRMECTHTTKQSAMMILKGIFFAITLTAFEYALKNLEIWGFLRIVFRVGFFGSLAGVAYVPYGLYNLIKSFMRN